MGFAISWLAIRKEVEPALLTTLGLEKTGETDEAPDSDWCMTHIGDWTIVWSNKYEPAKFRGIGTKLKSEMIIVDVEEHVMFVSASGFSNGVLDWRVTHDAQEAADHLKVEGKPPGGLSRIQQEEFSRRDDDPEVDFIFEIPVRMAQDIVGFRHDGAPESTFETLHVTSAVKPWWKFS